MVSPAGQTLIAGEAPPFSSNQQEVQLKFLLTGLLSGLPLPPFAIRMCPPLTTKNINHYQPLLAVGRWHMIATRCIKTLKRVRFFLEVQNIILLIIFEADGLKKRTELPFTIWVGIDGVYKHGTSVRWVWKWSHTRKAGGKVDQWQVRKGNSGNCNSIIRSSQL